MPLSKFGPFASVFEQGELDVPGYLPLLGLAPTESLIVIERIRHVLETHDPTPWVAALFEDPNWRPHLVGAIAVLLASDTKPYRGLIWSAIDAGSWVTPQLVVTGYYTDPAFETEAKRRIEAGCPVRPPVGLSPVERHSATGPAGPGPRSAKMLASLLAICEKIPHLEPWLEAVRADPEVVALLARDFDHSGSIALRWHESLLSRFRERGVELRPLTT